MKKENEASTRCSSFDVCTLRQHRSWIASLGECTNRVARRSRPMLTLQLESLQGSGVNVQRSRSKLMIIWDLRISEKKLKTCVSALLHLMNIQAGSRPYPTQYKCLIESTCALTMSMPLGRYPSPPPCGRVDANVLIIRLYMRIMLSRHRISSNHLRHLCN